MGSASKKSLFASEQDRPDVARRRALWKKYQDRVDPRRLVFIDETSTSTNMVRLRGRCQRGERLIGCVPQGHWKTMTFVAVLPACNTEAMQLHLTEIAIRVTAGAHAILILDQAGWHDSEDLRIPSNISLIPLPPRSPELNPQENIWQFMRQNWLSNRVFKTFDDIVDHCCFAWNTLIDQPWKIMSIARRDWAIVGQSL